MEVETTIGNVVLSGRLPRRCLSKKKPAVAGGLLALIRATSYSPTHLRVQYHRG